MINDWRSKWVELGGNDKSNEIFPFGFIHLSTWDDTSNTTCGDNDAACTVAIVRSGQTANYGYVPNDKMTNVYMATAIDLGDPNSPWTDIHPRYKQQVSKRLSDAALNVVYGNKQIYWQGPIANKVSLINDKLLIEFNNVDSSIQVKNNIGFEIYDGKDWVYVDINTPVLNNGTKSILVSIPTTCNGIAQKIRYNWYRAPCMPAVGIYLCSVYDMTSQLPALPFLMTVQQ